MKIREYSVGNRKLNTDLKICVVSDLHSMPYAACLEAVESAGADIIILAGDMLERLDGASDDRNELGFEFFSKVGKIAPTYYALGNHELFGSHREARREPARIPFVTEENLRRISATGVKLLDDACAEHLCGGRRLLIGGLSPAPDRPRREPDLEFARKFCALDGFKILVCHQPEYYDEYLKDLDFDLMLSGHTHGGQWKLFGRGIYAPDQGLFPKYSSGIYRDRLVVSAGASNPQKYIPRFFNPCEIVILNLKSQ